MVKTVATVNDMMCSMCEQHVSEAVRQAFPVKKVSASHTKNEVDILSEEPIDLDKLKATIDATGYTYVSATTEDADKKKKHGFFHRK